MSSRNADVRFKVLMIHAHSENPCTAPKNWIYVPHFSIILLQYLVTGDPKRGFRERLNHTVALCIVIFGPAPKIWIRVPHFSIILLLYLVTGYSKRWFRERLDHTVALFFIMRSHFRQSSEKFSCGCVRLASADPVRATRRSTWCRWFCTVTPHTIKRLRTQLLR
jgi:hypothetical protein